ncbi:hypothetical protein LVO79_19310 (plasmid) [Roseivivax marinus]|jgi:hypothetical protein|uniref:hypothetical protein n=1 Tax=Roseivivax marinus TaxID=1379903 RepID=UPI001F047DD4|nr:hypothetical protein [Roseivivax marinus]UMA67154.1 hypothetical protein LVO79_19310 [Roseivivax marinus]
MSDDTDVAARVSAQLSELGLDWLPEGERARLRRSLQVQNTSRSRLLAEHDPAAESALILTLGPPEA